MPGVLSEREMKTCLVYVVPKSIMHYHLDRSVSKVIDWYVDTPEGTVTFWGLVRFDGHALRDGEAVLKYFIEEVE